MTPPPADSEEVLEGGVANRGRVARIGDHVHRPAGPHADTIGSYLDRLAAGGFTAAPRPAGHGSDGRQRFDYIPGEVPVPPYPTWAQADQALASVARLLRRFHDASRAIPAPSDGWCTDVADPAGGPVVCHNDVCLENVVFRDGVAVALLDFDFAAPGRPEYDLAQFVRMCVPLDDVINAARLGWAPSDKPARLRLVADAYGLSPAARREFIEIIDLSAAVGEGFVRARVESGDPNFVAMWEAMGGDERYRRRAEWWKTERPRFAEAMESNSIGGSKP